MTLSICCEQCGNLLKVREELAGARVKCPRCGKAQRVTADGEPPPPQPPRRKRRRAVRLLLVLAACLGLVALGGLGYWRVWGSGPRGEVTPSGEDEALFESWLRAVNALDDAHAGLRDKNAAAKAYPRLRELAEEARDLKKRVNGLSDGKRKHLATKYEDELTKYEKKHAE